MRELTLPVANDPDRRTWLIATGVAAGSHNPSLPADWPGGFFRPCHGTSFDGSGRVYKNKPAPTNPEVPPYRYPSANRLRIGEAEVA